MHFTSIFATLLLASSALSIALPQDLELDDTTALASNETVIEDGVEPAFDPQELAGLDESTVEIEERDVDDIDEEYSSTLDKRSPASTILSCAKKLKGTRYQWGGCKDKAPFGPVKAGMDCSCLARTCVKKGTGTTIRKSTFPQYL
jgi:hypothetical protein